MSKTTAVAEKPASNLPAHLQAGGKKAKLGNLDQTDIIIPRIKLMQGTSPEVEEYDNAKLGELFHAMSEQSLGKELLAVPIVFRKSYALWAPRGDERGILARSSDAIHWDDWQDEDGNPKSFTVTPKGTKVPQTYTLAETVKESGLDQFGSSIEGEENSPPAASLSYQMMFIFPDHMDLGPAIIINTRTAVRPAKDLISKLQLAAQDHFAYQVMIKVTKEVKDGDSFYNFSYRMAGYADEEVYNAAKSMYDQYESTTWRATDEGEDNEATGGGTRSKGASDSNKF